MTLAAAQCCYIGCFGKSLVTCVDMHVKYRDYVVVIFGVVLFFVVVLVVFGAFGRWYFSFNCDPSEL